MRIYGPNGTALTAAKSAPRRPAGGGFAVTEEQGTQAPQAPAPYAPSAASMR